MDSSRAVFLAEAGLSPVHRCVVYVTSQSASENELWLSQRPGSSCRGG